MPYYNGDPKRGHNFDNPPCEVDCLACLVFICEVEGFTFQACTKSSVPQVGVFCEAEHAGR